MALTKEQHTKMAKEFGLPSISDFEEKVDASIERIHEANVAIHNSTPETDKLFTIKQAANRLGLSVTTVKNAVDDGELLTRTFGKRAYIPYSQIRKYQI